MRTLSALLCLAASGCILPVGLFGAFQSYYSEGDFAKTYSDRAHALAGVGCIEVAPDVREMDDRLVIDMRMGNACGDAVPIDLTQLRITTVTRTGERTTRVVYDPNEEIRPIPLPARGQAFEPLALRPIPKTASEALPPVGVCVDLSSMAPHKGDVAPICFRKQDDRWLARREP
jgi:hypothetical protein